MPEYVIHITNTPPHAAAIIRMMEAHAVPFALFLLATVVLAIIFNKGAPE
jgi:hypothetical protein